MSKSFYQEVIAARKAAQDREAEARRLEYIATHELTVKDQQVLRDVLVKCCSPDQSQQIMDIAGGKTLDGKAGSWHTLYTGDDLMCLNHLAYDVRRDVIEQLKQDIRTHYGAEFGVGYSDDTYDGGYAPEGRGVTINISW